MDPTVEALTESKCMKPLVSLPVNLFVVAILLASPRCSAAGDGGNEIVNELPHQGSAHRSKRGDEIARADFS